MTLLDTLKKYGREPLGYPSEKALKVMYDLNPNLDEDLATFLAADIWSSKVPLAHEEVAKNRYKPILIEYVPYIQAMIGNRYSKTYSISQVRSLMESLGYKVSSVGQLTNIWNKVETRTNLKDKERSAVKAAKGRVAEAKAQGKKRLLRKTEASLKQLDDARKVKAEKDLLRKLKREEALAKRRLAKAAAKKGKTKDDVKVKTNDRDYAAEKAKAEGKKILYEPTAKQAEFHSAPEDIVLYGGAAGG